MKKEIDVRMELQLQYHDSGIDFHEFVEVKVWCDLYEWLELN